MGESKLKSPTSIIHLGIFAIFITILYTYLNNPRHGKTIVTTHGVVQGTISYSRDGREFYQWLGIPYAKPPVGELRFASPQPFGNWNGIYDGRYYRSICSQRDPLTSIPTGNEDCLHLNIHAPKLNSERKLPVIVFIHGGAFNFGGSRLFGPHNFMDEDIIFVTLNYRLGAFGFLNTATTSIRGNMGLKDQLLAMKWINNNIEFFGGNPHQITLFGESAGAASVHQLLLSRSHGLFQKAISQSGTAINHWAIESLEVAVERSLTFAKDLECLPTSMNKFDYDDNNYLVNCLREKSSEELVEASGYPTSYYLLYPHQNLRWFSPSIEAINDSEAILVENPLEIMQEGRAHRIPWMIGLVSEEGLSSTAGFYQDFENVRLFESDLDNNMHKFFPNKYQNRSESKEIVNKIHEYYIPNVELNTDEKIPYYTKMFSDSSFYFSASVAASLQRQFSPIYLHILSRRRPDLIMNVFIGLKLKYPLFPQMILNLISLYWDRFVLGRPFDYIGVPHGAGNHYLFQENFLVSIPKDDDPDYRFSKDLVKLWVDFAGNDEQIKFRGVEFLPINQTGTMKYLDLTEHPSMVDEPFQARMAFLKPLLLDQ